MMLFLRRDELLIGKHGKGTGRRGADLSIDKSHCLVQPSRVGSLMGILPAP